ncbi:MAG: ABC transporter ATP-binding protein [Clostridia bacterium]|nr:ABC transporter ATP-binding protein [Clostridia bacterium]
MNLVANRIVAALTPVLTVGMYSLICYIIYLCVNDATAVGVDPQVSLETIPNMYMFLTYFMLIITAIGTVLAIAVSIPKAVVSAKRLNEILDAVSEIKDSENPVTPDENIKGVVEFKNVSFRYKPEDDGKKKSWLAKLLQKSAEKAKAKKNAENNAAPVEPEEKKKKTDEDAIHDISFVSRPGEVTAIIGITGCGKSTLVNLIPRLYDVTEGQILVDGVDVRDMKLSELHKRIAYVPQQSYLFSGTVKENIAFGNPDATDAEIWNAIEIAQAKSFVSSMADGIDSFVSQAGKNFSGGQKQRLAIARAVVKNAEICIFDDSFSALDLATDARLRASLRENLPDTNIIIVAQRVGTVINADRIIVLDDGKAVGIGTHKELLETCEVYRSIVASQLSEEVDAV